MLLKRIHPEAENKAGNFSKNLLTDRKRTLVSALMMATLSLSVAHSAYADNGSPAQPQSQDQTTQERPPGQTPAWHQ